MSDDRRADLHNHTTCSDGEYSPAGLVAEARALGLAALAVTDHDTLEALPEACEAGRTEGVEVLCGVEVTLRFTRPIFRGSLHLLLYFPEALLPNAAFRKEIEAVLAQGRGQALNQARIEAINAHFGPGGPEPLLPRPLTEADLLRHGSQITRRHFALVLSELGLGDRAMTTRILGNDSPAYLPSGMPLPTLAAFLPRWPLVKVLAHPAAGSFPGESHYKEVLPPFEIVSQLLPEFLALGLDGLEVQYPGHTPEWTTRMHRLAEELGLPIESGGSDCHDRSRRPLGAVTVPYATASAIQDLAEQRLQSMTLPV